MRTLWGIRHVRYYWHCYQMSRWYALWSHYGYVGPAQSDLEHLEAIWAGRA
jgi:hypothetical protein